MPGFRYRRPDSLDEALELLRHEGDGAKLLAGGQSLIPLISLGLAEPRLLIDLNQLSGRDYAAVRDGWVVVGLLARHAGLEHASPDFARAAPLLPRAARWIAHPAIRNRGTFIGSLAHGDPAAEWPAVALALSAELLAVSARGERRIQSEEFFLGPLTTVLEPDEILVEARWRPAPTRTGAAVQELTYRHGDYALVGVTAQLSLREDGVIEDARVALFGVGETPIRAVAAEQALVGAGPSMLEDAAAAMQEAARPSSDATATAEYRREMVRVFGHRALDEAYRSAGGAAV